MSVHSQEFCASDAAGILTEEDVRATVRREFMAWGATGRYAAFVFPPATWYEEVVLDEYLACREALANTY